jgi:hypothetical protein
MHLVKWLRKNNTKIMAVVVIVLMIGFVGGTALTQLLRGRGGYRDTIAYFDGKRKITPEDVMIARQELELLQSLQADRVLQSQGLIGFFMSELLFSQNRSTPSQLSYVTRMIQQNQFRISDRQLHALYQRTVAPAFYWLLLREEARTAGLRISTELVGQSLAQIIPQVFPGQSYGVVMADRVSRYGVPEERVLRTFADMLGVLQYAQIVCATENLTTAQIRHTASRQGETLDVEFVQLEAEAFVDTERTPPAQELRAQFDQYKDFYAGQVSESNPYGFGYKLPARVQMDYIAVKTDDVAEIVTAPTEEEAERYYRDNRDDQFTRQVPADPNDPNSPTIPEVVPYAEIAEDIREQLTRQAITTRAEQILADAKNLADAELEAIGIDDQEPDVNELKDLARDYAEIAEELGKEHGVRLYSGRTGLLNAVDVQTDEVLRRLVLMVAEAVPVRLYQLAFSTPTLEGDAALLMFGAPARLYRTFGPLKDEMAAMGGDVSDQIMAVMRVTRAEKAGPPAGPDVTFGTQTLVLDQDEQKDGDTRYSVAEKVTEDIRKLAAWDVTKQRADEFLALARKDGWDAAVAEFNHLYGRQDVNEPNDPNVFALDRLDRRQRISSDQLQVLAAQTAGNPASELILAEARVEKQFLDRLYSLVPPDVNAVPPLPAVMPFKPNQSVYCLKDLSVDRIDLQRYRAMKGQLLQREDAVQTQSMAAVYFNPDHVLKRARFTPARETEPVDEEEPESQAEDAAS